MQQSVRRRQSTVGGYARGAATRLRIIEAAIEVFGELGYDSATTRQIAHRAGVNTPALQYYFDSKEGLHLACAEHIVEQVWSALRPAIEAAEQCEGDDEDSLIEALCVVLDAIADYALSSMKSLDLKTFMARGQSVGAGPGFDLIRERLTARIQRACAHLVAGVLGRDAAETEVMLRVIAILGQGNTFHVGRGSALAALGWTDYSGERLEQIKSILRIHTRAILLSARQEGASSRDQGHQRIARAASIPGRVA